MLISRMLLLTLATMIWGFGFVGTRWTMLEYSPVWSNSLRFVFAGLIALAILLIKKSFRRPLSYFKKPLLCSLVLLAGLQLQTIGIKYTSLAMSGFLTTFYAVFTPILVLIIYRRKFRATYWVLVFFAFLGIFFLCDLSFENFALGDWFVLASALLFSIHILMIDNCANDYSAFELNAVQCFFMGIFGFIFAYIYEGPVSFFEVGLEQLTNATPLAGFVILSVFSSHVAFTIQMYSQKMIAPHIVSLIFLLESVFASIFGYLFFSEKISGLGFVGVFIVLTSVALIPILSEPRKRLTPRGRLA